MLTQLDIYPVVGGSLFPAPATVNGRAFKALQGEVLVPLCRGTQFIYASETRKAAKHSSEVIDRSTTRSAASLGRRQVWRAAAGIMAAKGLVDHDSDAGKRVSDREASPDESRYAAVSRGRGHLTERLAWSAAPGNAASSQSPCRNSRPLPAAVPRQSSTGAASGS